MAVKWGKKRTINFYADESTVNENSRIELTSTRTSLHPEFDFKFNNGWFDGAHIPTSSGTTIKFDNHFRGDSFYSSMYFKATFYNPYNNKLGEKIIELPDGQVAESETFEVPDGTNRIEINVTKGFAIIDSATFRYRPVKDLEDDITITLGDCGSWKSMEFNCSECWQRI